MTHRKMRKILPPRVNHFFEMFCRRVNKSRYILMIIVSFLNLLWGVMREKQN